MRRHHTAIRRYSVCIIEGMNRKKGQENNKKAAKAAGNAKHAPVNDNGVDDTTRQVERLLQLRN